MNLTPTELERLVVFQAAELARRRRARGLRLNQAEADALLSDEAFEAARDGLDLAAITARVSTILTTDDVLPGVDSLVNVVCVEALTAEGHRLVTVFDPIGPGDAEVEVDPLGAPGQVTVADGDIELRPEATRVEIEVEHVGDRPIHVTSHQHLFEVNGALRHDRERSFGFRLDIPAGTTLRFEPGERRTVVAVAIGGRGVVTGHSHLTDGDVHDPDVRARALARLAEWHQADR